MVALPPDKFKDFEVFCRDQAARAADDPHQPENSKPSVCPHCAGAGYRRVQVDGYSVVQKCVCRRQQEVVRAVDAANIPKKFRDTTLEEQSPDGRQPFRLYGGTGVPQSARDYARKSQKRALEVCRELRDTYTRHFVEGKKVDDLYGLMLFGDCGRGKTRLACSLLCDLIHRGLYDVTFIEYNELFKEIKFSYNTKDATYRNIFDRLNRAKVLVIDDFGMEVSDNLVWVLDNIGYIINERYEMNLPTILTSNYWIPLKNSGKGGAADPANVYEQFKSWEIAKQIKRQQDEESKLEPLARVKDRVNYRLRSRIGEMCFELEVEGFDFRKLISRHREARMELRHKNRGPS